MVNQRPYWASLKRMGKELQKYGEPSKGCIPYNFHTSTDDSFTTGAERSPPSVNFAESVNSSTSYDHNITCSWGKLESASREDQRVSWPSQSLLHERSTGSSVSRRSLSDENIMAALLGRELPATHPNTNKEYVSPNSVLLS